ncbi:MAG: TM2 domain-containing protein [Methylicorpusculum sp.]|uniref:TM2 domain-containing protein n=1 Tax=Methylicorpusculum sp. TaxID=2713644 RepID=UPI00272177E8|nr:TM2 domain-containing protein [Methylicorpusculum sp.]MDO8846654.1 TM2 domain-containing protein [Methylicorpusculum sp.]MDO8940275.1 TM2 domain-containing protein [Methylicorpusculum sp.]MDO9241439.1 TM2 domain-containing protein [Methylicorpusculum sp.]MDP2178244.1 TM2 domain-containing protein [Methylicorpusculum sp.]MDP2200769.1 TM2 domain-containing protein [Methylicorpusculum sp.]
MIGHIESFDLGRQTGVIKSGDSFYEFHLDQWTSPGEPETGDDVMFEQKDGTVTTIGLVGVYLENKAVKSRMIAVLLAFFLGLFGAHRFYLGFYLIGLCQIVVTFLTGGYGVLWGFLEFALLLSKHMDKDAKGRPLK